MTKHGPERTCIACGAKREQAKLLRVASQKGAAPTFDERDRLPGRGAYLCAQAACLEKAWQRKAVERALKLGAPAPRGLKQQLERVVEARRISEAAM